MADSPPSRPPERDDGRPPAAITLRCGFCLTKNRVDVGRAADGPRCGKCGRPILVDRPVKVTEEDFDATVLGAGVPVLVDFYADWCAPCRMAAPILDEIAGARVGDLVVAKVDSDLAPGLSQRFGIRGIPTLILFRDGAEAERLVGFDPGALRALADRASG
jgi:thioredoxin 2